MTYTRVFEEDVLMPVRQSKNGVKASFDVVRHLVGSRTGQRMADWKEKIRRGEDASTPFQTDRYSYSELEGGSVSLTAYFPGNPGAGNPSQTGSGFASPPSDVLGHLVPDQPIAEAVALNKVYKQINSELSHWSGASSLAEFSDVIRQFGAPFSSILDLTNRRLNRLYLERRGLSGTTTMRKIQWAHIVASTWLEYAFGLAPLISDTKKAAEALSRWQFENTEDFRPRSKVVARGVDTKASFSTQNVTLGNTWFAGRNASRTTTEHRVQYTCGISSISSTAALGSNERLIQLLGFRPQDWIPAAWEVVPWSFLFDYFTNVGDILQAAATTTANVRWVNKTVTDRTTRESYCPVSSTLTNLNSQPFVANVSPGHLGKSTTIRTTSVRSTNVQLGVPPLVFTLPGQPGQWANMAALLFRQQKSSSALWVL